MGWKEFWEWNNKMLKDDAPVIAWQYKDDGKGNKGCRMNFVGSKFQAVQTAPELFEEELLE